MNARRRSILKMSGITKRFGPVVALSDVDFELYDGEVLALLGDNGAGKSTLIKIISGYYRPDEGHMTLSDQRVSFSDPHEARAAGIETIYQDLALFDNLDVSANVFAGKEVVGGGWRRPFGFVDRRAMRARVNDAISDMAVSIPRIDNAVETFSGGQRQSVAIARAVMWGRKVLIMDEPTAALGVRETGKVLDLIRTLCNNGLSIVLIMHNIDQVLEVASRAIILRRGNRRGSIDIKGPDDHEAHNQIVRLLL